MTQAIIYIFKYSIEIGSDTVENLKIYKKDNNFINFLKLVKLYSLKIDTVILSVLVYCNVSVALSMTIWVH